MALGECLGQCTINRYPEDVVIRFLCHPHSDEIEYAVVNEIDFDTNKLEEVEVLDAFEVLAVYGKNNDEMNECFETIWNFIK